MSESQASWSADGSNIPNIDPHTKAKHQIIEVYIKNLVITLAKGIQQKGRLTLIDGFCGGGIYNDLDNKTMWYGSPIRLINAVMEGLDFVRNEMSKPNYELDYQFIFLDKKQDHLNCLKNYALPSVGWEELAASEKCSFITGEFEDLSNFCLLKLEQRKGHSFWLLDPFGWTHVSMNTIRKIMSVRGSEILYTYMIDFIKRFLTQRNKKLKNAFGEILEADEYYNDFDLYKLDRGGQQCYLRNESMRLFRDKGQAKHAITFSLIPKGELLVEYYLMHLCNNITAIEVMKQTFNYFNNLSYQYHFEVYGTGFKTSEFYEQTPDLLYDITKSNYEIFIQKLDPALTNIILDNKEGILLSKISELSMEFNPVPKEYYIKHLNNLREEKFIEIIRKNKKTGQFQTIYDKNIRKSDVIRYTGIKQLSLF